MKIIRNVLMGILICIFLIGGFLYYQYSDVLGVNIIAPSIEKYVKQAILFMDNQGIYNDTNEWIEVKKEVLEQTKNCKTYEETYPYLEKALKAAGGKHSKLIRYDQVDSSLVANYPDMECLEGNILYIHLPDFSGNPDEAQQYANSVYEFIRSHLDAKGVIIDLQHNTGGDMGPMVAAISCLLPDGEVLAFENHGTFQSVIVENGTINGGGTSLSMVNSYKLTDVKVAILQDELTASSAEATLLTFRGLDYVKTFGKETAGYCSCNNVRKMYDNTILLLTIGSDVTRTSEYFNEEPIQPDVRCENAREEAIKWILERE